MVDVYGMHVVQPASSSDLPTVYSCSSLSKVMDGSRETERSRQEVEAKQPKFKVKTIY